MTEEEKKEGAAPEDAQDRESEEQAARSGKVVTGLIILVLVIILIQVFYLINTGKSRSLVTTVNQPSTPLEKATRAAVRSPSPTPASALPISDSGSATYVPPAGDSGSAVSGTIKMERLMYGLLKLEEGPKAATREQAAKILGVLQGHDEGFRVVEYGSTLLKDILTAPQQEYLARKAAEDVKKSRQVVSAEELKAVRDRVAGLAGERTGTMQVPADKGLPPKKPAAGATPTVPAVMLLLQWFDEMQKERSVALSAEQAKKILPILKAVNLPSSEPQKQILPFLTKEQKTQIDILVKGFRDRPETMSEYPTKLLAIYRSRVR